MPKRGAREKRLAIMVSSTVYGIEELLDQVYAVLNGFGYEVWMSHKGTVPIYPNKTAFESCLLAVERCDLFLAIITPQYGSGVVDGELGITHQELLKAIEKNRPRWVLAHAFVPFARSLFMKLGCKKAEDREELLKKLGYETAVDLKKLGNREKAVLDDFRVIDMYDVDLSTAQEEKPENYASFNAFFTRQLKPEARPVAVVWLTEVMSDGSTSCTVRPLAVAQRNS